MGAAEARNEIRESSDMGSNTKSRGKLQASETPVLLFAPLCLGQWGCSINLRISGVALLVWPTPNGSYLAPAQGLKGSLRNSFIENLQLGSHTETSNQDRAPLFSMKPSSTSYSQYSARTPSGPISSLCKHFRGEEGVQWPRACYSKCRPAHFSCSL